MIRKLFAVSLVAVAAVPAAFAQTSSRDVHASASRQCIAVRTKIGPVSFGHTFASFGSCVSALTPLTRQNANTAAASCRSERADASFSATHGGKTFARFYGAGSANKNAFGRCVSAKERAETAADLSAAFACRTEVGAAAFAACVASKASPPLAVSPVQPSPAPAPQEPGSVAPVGGCGGAQEGAGPAHPLATDCAVSKTT
jgi:hypothetical protein